MNRSGVILYGPPAAGKDTITGALHTLDSRFVLFSRLKSGPGRSTGYRMTTEAVLADLRLRAEIIWENRRYGATYAIDLGGVRKSFEGNRLPVFHLGQPEGVDALVRCTKHIASWTVVSLWYPRDMAYQRLIGRGSQDIDARLTAWDETPELAGADLRINTGTVPPSSAAATIAALVHAEQAQPIRWSGVAARVS